MVEDGMKEPKHILGHGPTQQVLYTFILIQLLIKAPPMNPLVFIILTCTMEVVVIYVMDVPLGIKTVAQVAIHPKIDI